MLKQILSKLKPYQATLVAVSKLKSTSDILRIYETGHRDFGENRVQELVEKQQKLPKDIRWHMIGHLQKNKVKYIAPFVYMLHSVDSFSLLKMIEKQAAMESRKIKVLLQLKIAAEESKFGLTTEACKQILESEEFAQLKHVKICGLMGMATFSQDTVQIRSEFRKLKDNFNQFKTRYFSESPDFKELSMGMSGDYEIALEEGSTIVRIGSLIFGPRV